MAGLFVSTVVEVPRSEYEKLVRESEQLAVIKNVLMNSKYPSTEEIKIILDLKEVIDKPTMSFEEMLGEKEGEE